MDQLQRKANHTPLLKTKLMTPFLRSNHLQRPRLLQRLSSTHPLTIVSAPAGYGKSTMIADWVSRINLSKIWLSLDQEDNDPLLFFAYFIAGLQEVSHSMGQMAFSLLSTPQLPPISALAATLGNELEELSAPVIFVLDDYHLITNSYIHEGIRYLLEHQPHLLHMVIITREDPPFPIGRWRAKREITEIRVEDLRFSPEEARNFFQQTLEISLTDEEIYSLQSRTEGWITGLQLAGLSLQDCAAEKVENFIRQFTGTHRYIIDYLFEEVFQLQSEETRHFLCATSILRQFNASLANAVTGREDGQIILKHLDQANLFVIALDARQEWFRYHHLFQEFLRTELSPDKEKLLYDRAAIWFEGQQEHITAIEHYLLARNCAAVERLIPLVATQLFYQGKLQTLLNWIDALPNEQVIANYKLCIYKAWCLFLTGQGTDALVYIQAAETNPNRVTDSQHNGLHLALMTLVYMRSDQSKVLACAKQAVELIGEEDLFFRTSALLSLAQAYAFSGNSADAAATFYDTMLLARRIQYDFGAITALVNLASHLIWDGQRQKAVTLCQEGLYQYTNEQGKLLPLAQLIYIPLGMAYYEANELEKARECLAQAVTFCKETSLARMMGPGEWVYVQTLDALGLKMEARQALQETRTIAENLGLIPLQQMLNALDADLALKKNQPEQAFLWCEQVQNGITYTAGFASQFMFFTYLRARIRQGATEHVTTWLRDFTPFAEKHGTRSLTVLHLLQADEQAHSGNLQAAVQSLTTAVQLASPESYLRIFLEEGDRIAGLLPQVREISPGFVDSLIKALPVSTSERDELPVNQQLVEPLSERELEILSLVAEGLSNQELADTLCITVGTAKWHINNIYGKLGVNRRTLAVNKARELHLLKT